MSESTPLANLVSCLMDLTPGEAGGGRATYTGSTLGLPGGGIFGGQFLGQAIRAAQLTIPTMPVKSLTVHFPRAAKDTGSVQLQVETLHQGRVYATQRVELRQQDKTGAEVVAFTATVMSHQPGDGPLHQQPMPEHAGSPDDARPFDMGMIPWETRMVGDTDVNSPRAQKAEQLLWTRVSEPLSTDGPVFEALLAFVTDLLPLGTAFLPHEGVSQHDAHAGILTAVVAHQMYFHRPIDLTDWLLIHQTSPVAASASVFGVAHVYNRSGELVCSYTQESMFRTAAPAAG